MTFILFLLNPANENFPRGDLRSARAFIKTARQPAIEAIIESHSTAINFFQLVGIAWFSEKMNINVKYKLSNMAAFIENPMLIHSEKYEYGDLEQVNANILWENYAKIAIPSEYGYKLISKLGIKEELSRQADQWVHSNLQGDWIAVHYRGTDATRRLIRIEAYIAYLKEVLDKHSNIFACSDQAQFIEQIKEAFPGRIFAREIKRSYDDTPSHRSTTYRGKQQVEDALMDILILSRAKLIYTTGSWFVEVVRFFNPAIKIVTFELLLPRFKYHRSIDNFISVPKAHLIKKQNKGYSVKSLSQAGQSP